MFIYDIIKKYIRPRHQSELIEQLMCTLIKNRSVDQLEKIYDILFNLFEFTPLQPYQEIQILDQYNGPFEYRLIGYKYRTLDNNYAFLKFCNTLCGTVFINISKGDNTAVFNNGFHLKNILKSYSKKYDIDFDTRIQKCLFMAN